VQGLRLGAVAQELGYTTAALYRYYPSREALIKELQKLTLELLAEALSTLLTEAESLSPLAKLQLYTQFYTLYAERSPASFALNSSIFANPKIILDQEMRRETVAIIGQILSVLSDLIKEAELNSAHPPLSLAAAYWSTLYGGLMALKYSSDLPVLKPIEQISALCIGWGASPQQVKKAREESSTWQTWLYSHEMSKITALDHLNIETPDNKSPEESA
jgi:AcrR family transcriptional regulator